MFITLETAGDFVDSSDGKSKGVVLFDAKSQPERVERPSKNLPNEDGVNRPKHDQLPLDV